MVHTIEAVFDPATEDAVRSIWADLAAAGIPSQAPAARPHVTMLVSDGEIPASVDRVLAPLTAGLPMDCTVGAPLVFGASRSAVLARIVVPTAGLLDLHGAVHRLCEPLLPGAPMGDSLPGHWTAHTTLARRVREEQLGRALRIAARPREIPGRVAALRRWEGDRRVEHLLGPDQPGTGEGRLLAGDGAD